MRAQHSQIGDRISRPHRREDVVRLAAHPVQKSSAPPAGDESARPCGRSLTPYVSPAQAFRGRRSPAGLTLGLSSSSNCASSVWEARRCAADRSKAAILSAKGASNLRLRLRVECPPRRAGCHLDILLCCFGPIIYILDQYGLFCCQKHAAL